MTKDMRCVKTEIAGILCKKFISFPENVDYFFAYICKKYGNMNQMFLFERINTEKVKVLQHKNKAKICRCCRLLAEYNPARVKTWQKFCTGICKRFFKKIGKE